MLLLIADQLLICNWSLFIIACIFLVCFFFCGLLRVIHFFSFVLRHLCPVRKVNAWERRWGDMAVAVPSCSWRCCDFELATLLLLTPGKAWSYCSLSLILCFVVIVAIWLGEVASCHHFILSSFATFCAMLPVKIYPGSWVS